MQRHAKNKYRQKNGPTMFGMLGIGAAGSMFKNRRFAKQHDKLHEGSGNKNNNNENNSEKEKPRVVTPKVPVSKKEE